MLRNRGLAYIMAFCLLITAVVSMPQIIFGEEENAADSQPELIDTGAPGKDIPDPDEKQGLNLGIAAKSAVLLDAGSGTFLYEQNSHEKLPPASITKIITMLLVLEAIDRGQISLQDKVTISERAASMGGSQMYMEQGEQQTVENLLKGMAIGSANDACVACAEYVGGSEQIFVEMMNKRAGELGMKDTNFVNTNGLPVADHYTSAYDIGIMSKELLKHAEVHEWLTTWQTTVLVGLEGKKQTEFGLTNTNRLIKLYPGANGIKTGFTQEAGYCLSGSATKGNLTLIAVVLDCDTTQLRWGETMRLLDYGFATYENAAIAKKGEILGTIHIEKGMPEYVNAVAAEDINMLVKKGEAVKVSKTASLYKRVKAPLAEGDQIGELIVLKGEEEVGRFPIAAETAVATAGLFEIYIRMLKTLI